MAVTCFWPTSVTKSGGTAASGGPSNSRVVNALPSVNSTTVTDLEPSGEFPDTVVPPVPASAGPGVPLTEPPSPERTPRQLTLPSASGTNGEGEMTNGGQFDTYNAKGGKFRFRLKASSGEIIAGGRA